MVHGIGAPASGQDSDRRARHEAQMKQVLEWFPKADANQDGILTEEEAARFIPDADKNKDGKVTPPMLQDAIRNARCSISFHKRLRGISLVEAGSSHSRRML